MTVRKSVSSTPCVSWSSWMPVAPATPSSVTAPTGPCAAKMAALTLTTARDEERSVWPRPSSPSSTRGPVVSGIRRRNWKWLLLSPSKPVVLLFSFFFFFAIPLSFLVSTSRKCDSPPPLSAVSRLSVCLFLIWNVSEVAQRCALNGCVRAGGWGRLKVMWCAGLPWKNCAFTSLLHSFTSRPSPHPSHASPRNETPPSCFIHPLPVISSPLLLFSVPVCLVCCCILV